MKEAVEIGTNIYSGYGGAALTIAVVLFVCYGAYRIIVKLIEDNDKKMTAERNAFFEKIEKKEMLLHETHKEYAIKLENIITCNHQIISNFQASNVRFSEAIEKFIDLVQKRVVL